MSTADRRDLLSELKKFVRRSPIYSKGTICVCLAIGTILAGSMYAGRARSSATPSFPIAVEPPALAPQPMPASLVSDKGKFRIMAGGEQVGKEEFEIGQDGANWVARGTSEVKSAEGTVRVAGTLELQSDGTPLHYEWSTQGAKKASAAITFSGPSATIELKMEGARPFTQQFTFNSSQIAILDNNLYHQYAILARLYDWNKKGAQTFSVLVPQELTPGSVTVESLGQQTVDGKKLDELSVKTEDLELDLYLDGQRLVRIASPTGNAEIVRE
jgi:hypothetical protein